MNHAIAATASGRPGKSMMAPVDDQQTTGFSSTPISPCASDSSLVEMPPADSPNQSVESPNPPVPNAIPVPVVRRSVRVHRKPQRLIEEPT